MFEARSTQDNVFFSHPFYQVHNGSCYLIVQAPACLSCSGGQGRGCLSVMVGVVGGILLSSCPLASLSCPPPVLSLSLVWISCLVRSRNSPAKVATHQGRCHNSKVFVASASGDTLTQLLLVYHCSALSRS